MEVINYNNVILQEVSKNKYYIGDEFTVNYFCNIVLNISGIIYRKGEEKMLKILKINRMKTEELKKYEKFTENVVLYFVINNILLFINKKKQILRKTIIKALKNMSRTYRRNAKYQKIIIMNKLKPKSNPTFKYFTDESLFIFCLFCKLAHEENNVYLIVENNGYNINILEIIENYNIYKKPNRESKYTIEIIKKKEKEKMKIYVTEEYIESLKFLEMYITDFNVNRYVKITNNIKYNEKDKIAKIKM